MIMVNKVHTIAAPQHEPVNRSVSLRMQVKLIRKFANAINGIDLSSVRVGDIVDLSAYHAALLITEGWAEAGATGEGKSRRPSVVSTPNGDRRVALWASPLFNRRGTVIVLPHLHLRYTPTTKMWRAWQACRSHARPGRGVTRRSSIP